MKKVRYRAGALDPTPLLRQTVWPRSSKIIQGRPVSGCPMASMFSADSIGREAVTARVIIPAAYKQSTDGFLLLRPTSCPSKPTINFAGLSPQA